MSETINIIAGWLRDYQREMLTDTSRYRVVLKSRQVGISDTIALEMVLVASGLVDELEGWEVPCHNCTIISKTDKDAKDVIAKCKDWIRRLKLDESLGPYLETDAFSAHEIKFRGSTRRIVSVAQSPEAGRSLTGHLYLDEYAFYQFQREIFRAAAASTESRPDLRITVVSTPNGQGDHFHEIWTDHQFFGDWSRHEIDIHQARAQGMPVDIDSIRAKYTADQFSQEFECSFLGGEARFFDAELWARSQAVVDGEMSRLVLGIDTASIVDNTAVQIWEVRGSTMWMRDTFVISRIPYDGGHGRLGQVDIVAAITEVLKPSLVLIDRTGEDGNMWTRGAGFFQLFTQRMSGRVPCVGVRIDRGWKDTHVQKLKVAMQTGSVKVDTMRRDLVFSNRAINWNPGDVRKLVSEGFEASPFPVLRTDFLKVRRKWTNTNQTTFDTERDSSGHGDAFWAAVIGYSGLNTEAPTKRGQYEQLLDAALGTASGGFEGEDYAGFL